ncbi:MAG: S-layer homology domain-containing protein [Proteocatella sp.]
MSMVPGVAYGSEAVVTDDSKYDVFISTDKQLGFNATELSTLVDAKLAAMNVSGETSGSTSNARIESTTVIDTTDLSSWYVYDHYDADFWGNSANWPAATTSRDDAWMKYYNKASTTDVTRPADFSYDPSATSSSYSTIEAMVNSGSASGYAYAHHFREHIYSYEDASGNPGMWFAGYGSAAYADFLFYPTASTNSKNVKFTVDSAYVNIHSLNGAGYLINTGIDANGYIKGYILYYTFASADSVSSVTLYKINENVLASTLHSGTSYISSYATPVKSISSPTWASKMDIELDITPTKLVVNQGASNSTKSEIMNQTLADSGYNGFGPLVKYSGHSCPSSSVFKFSNLEMSFEGATGNSLLAGIEDADYLKDANVKKFFVNLVASDYGATASDKDLAYLNILQDKNINLITNYTNGGSNYITNYMGTNSNNLNSLPTGNSNPEKIQTHDINTMGSTTDIDQLAQDIAYYIYSATYSEAAGVIADTTTTVAKLYLLEKTEDTTRQVSIIRNELVNSSGQKVYLDNTGTVNAESKLPVYTIIKPGATTIETISPSFDDDGKNPHFLVTSNKTTWPIGIYSVTLSYGDDSVPATTKFEIHQDTTAPTVSAVKNGNVVDLNFTNTPSVGNNTFTSELDSYVIVNTSTAEVPTSDWTNKVSIINYKPEPITQAGYMHVLVKDSAGNIGHTSIEIIQVFPTIDAPPITSAINYGQSLSASSLSGGSAIYNSEEVSGTFTWTDSEIKPTAGTTNSYSVTFTPTSAFYATITTEATIVVNKVVPEISLADKTIGYTGSQISVEPAIVTGVLGVAAPTGVVAYTYYTDVSCSTLTTPANSGALNNGSAPEFAGKYYVKATIASSDNYNAATTDAPATLIIKATNDGGLSIGDNQTKEYGDASFQLSATGGSGTGVVTFTSSTPLSASVTNDGYVTINAVGTTTITATKASDGNYEAQSIAITITVKQKDVSYTISDFEKTYSGSSQNVNVIPSVSTLVAGTDFTITYKKDNKVVVNPIENGSYEITVSTNNNNYIGSATGTMIISSIGQSELHITGVPNNNIQYKDTFSLTANGGSGTGAITWAVTSGKATIDSATGLVEVTGTGAVTITATKSSDNNHNLQLATISFTATPKIITVTAEATTRNYEAGNKTITVKLNTGETGLDASYDTATVLTDNAGTGKEVTVSGVSFDDSNYKPASMTIFTTVTINSIGSGGITIEGQPSDIDGQPSNITFGDKDFKLSTDSTGTGKVIWDSADSDVAVVDSSTGVVTIKGVGSVKITATKLSDGNYNEQSTSIEITVNPKEVTYSITNNTKPYNGLAQYANVIPSSESLIEGVDYIVTYSLKKNTMVNQPEAVEENAVVNPIEEVKENAVVNPIEEVKEDAVVNPIEEVKEDAVVNPIEEVKEDAVVNPIEEVKEDAVVNPIEEVKEDAAVNPIEEVEENSVVNQPEAIEEDTVTYSIKKNTGINLTQTIEANAAVNPIEAGEYNITIETLNKNYKGGSTEGILTIQSIEQNYTLEIDGLPEYIEYEDTFAIYANGGNGTGAITWAVTSGNANIDESTGLVEVTGIGAVTITATKAGDGNYKDQIESVTFTTNKKQISLAISNTNKTYNGSVQDVTVTGTATKNSTYEEIMKVSYLMQTDISQTDFRNIGTYNVSVDINEDYTNLYVLDRGYNAVAFIAKANLIITADNKVKIYDEVNPVFTLNYTLLGTDEMSSFNEPIISCTADKKSNVGDYVIKLSYDGDNGNNNYNIKLVDGKLSITSREPDPTPISGGSGGSGGAYTVDKTIKVAGVTGTLFENTDLIKADADMKNAFNKSVEIKITEDSQASQMNFNNMDKEYKIYPFDISLYEKDSNNKIQPNNGYNVTITLPLPKELWDSRDNASIVYASNGKVITLPSKLIQNNGVWCLEFNAEHFSPYAIVVKNDNTWVNPFTDVNTNDWFYDALSYVNSADMMSGTSATTFEPNIGTTRGMIVTIIHRLAGSPKSLKASSFEDVEKGKWYSEAIDWASDNGIVHGYDAKTFGPNDNITREQMVSILYNYANYMKYDMNYTENLSNFEDSNDISMYANTSMNWAVAKGIMSGTTTTKLTPKGKATRGQVAAILMKFIENIAK